MSKRAMFIANERQPSYLAAIQLAELLGVELRTLNSACQSSRTCVLVPSGAGSAMDIVREVRQLRVNLQIQNWFVAYLPHWRELPDRTTRADLGLSVAGNPSELLDVCGRFLPLLRREELVGCARSSIIDEVQLAGHKLSSDLRAGLKLTMTLSMQAYKTGIIADLPPGEFKSREEASRWLERIQKGEQNANT